jgi:hypothetical protein
MISVKKLPGILFSHIFRADVFSKFCEPFSELLVSCKLGGSSHPKFGEHNKMQLMQDWPHSNAMHIDSSTMQATITYEYTSHCPIP